VVTLLRGAPSCILSAYYVTKLLFEMRAKPFV
jgi:hypothetical protein